MLTLFQPVWLLLTIPLAAAWFLFPLPTRLLRVLRAAIFLLLILAMCYPAIRLPDRAGAVVVVVDRSESMPPNAASSQIEILDLLRKAMGPRDLLGVVSFGRQAVVERAPQRGDFAGFSAQIGPEHSNLNDALAAALSLLPSDASARLLVVSDGKWTGEDPAAAAARAAGRGIAIDYRLLTRPQVNEVAIQSFQAPASVLPGQAYLLNAWVQSPVDQEVQYQLRRGGTIIASGTKAVSSGLSRLAFRDRAAQPGTSEYVLTVQAASGDPVPENNQARALVGIEGPRPILHVSQAGADSGLARLLQAGGLSVAAKTPGQCQWSLEELSNYAAVLLENVPAGRVGNTGLESLASWVEETGSGLMMTGGQKSYGQGGYYKSPLDRVLPVSMEMRREHRKMSLAIVVALDRSGSMAAPAGLGRTKMDLANIGTAQVLDLLSPNDEIGVIAVDSSPHVIVEINDVETNLAHRDRILSINSMGGGIFVFEALSAAAQMLLQAKAETRHIILFADAADSEEPGRYVELLEKCRQASITVSVVGLGTEGDVDANLLKDIAARGGGSCYFTAQPEEIPQLFAQDTFTVARSTFIEETSPFQWTAGFSLLGAAPFGPPPPLGGYNLCYLRPEASLGAVSADEFTAPVVASWNAGNGRVLSFLGEADGQFSGSFAKWDQAGEFYATLARWTAGQQQPLPEGMLVTQEIRDGVCFVQVHLDPDRSSELISALPRVRVLHGLPGAPPRKLTAAMQWKSADLLEAALPVSGRETMLNTVEIPGQQPLMLPPVCLPYSPEFAPDQPNRGPAALVQLAQVTGGQERLELTQIWKELPVKPRFVEITPWLISLAILLFLLEILERRTGLLSRLRPATTMAGQQSQDAEKTSPGPSWKRWGSVLLPRLPRFRPIRSAAAAPAAKARIQATPSPEGRRAASEAEREPASNLDAFRQARQRAGRRTGPPGSRNSGK